MPASSLGSPGYPYVKDGDTTFVQAGARGDLIIQVTPPYMGLKSVSVSIPNAISEESYGYSKGSYKQPGNPLIFTKDTPTTGQYQNAFSFFWGCITGVQTITINITAHKYVNGVLSSESWQETIVVNVEKPTVNTFQAHGYPMTYVYDTVNQKMVLSARSPDFTATINNVTHYPVYVSFIELVQTYLYRLYLDNSTESYDSIAGFLCDVFEKSKVKIDPGQTSTISGTMPDSINFFIFYGNNNAKKFKILKNFKTHVSMNGISLSSIPWGIYGEATAGNPDIVNLISDGGFINGVADTTVQNPTGNNVEWNMSGSGSSYFLSWDHGMNDPDIVALIPH